MIYLCYINAVEAPIVDNSIPNIPGAHVGLFYLDAQKEYKLLVDTFATEDPSTLTRQLEPYGLKAV